MSNSKPKRIGIYGGSFNPIHNGHISIARELLGTGFVDEILFVVSPHNPLKEQADLWPDELRLDLTRKALSSFPRLEASDIEFHLPKPSFMWATLQELKQKHPSDEIILLIGADNWLCFDRWFRHEDILRDFEIGVYPRPGFELPETTAIRTSDVRGVSFLPTGLYDISSTEIRNRIAAGEPVGHLVPKEIELFLTQKP